jgi:hypothetical protein
MCFNSASSSQSQASKVTDQRAGVGGSGIAMGRTSVNDGGSITAVYGSDDVAIASIEGQRELSEKSIETVYESTKNALTTTTDLISQAFTGFLNVSDNQLTRANQNVTASREFAANLIADNTESSDERLIKVVQYGMGAAVLVVLIQSGALKQITGAFK